MPPSPPLPIHEIEADLVAALHVCPRVILRAPTGSGKTTRVPQMLLRHGFLEAGQAVVLQPRRLATRLLAARVAAELDSPLGETVGYQVSLDARVGPRTRIRFVTEGVLLRQLIGDPGLHGVSVVIFDEFHERHLYGDLSLGRLLQVQRDRRPDLRLIVMSATLQTDPLAALLGDCRLLSSEGRTFPVATRYLPRNYDPEKKPVWEVAADAVEEGLRDGANGRSLVFMAGAHEIARTLEALGRRPLARDRECLPLHGELSAAEQDRAASAGGDDGRIIVATNVAETSLTIDGVGLVVDSGLARIPRFDPRRGINTLLIEKISRASAEQRAGRAGRTGPGLCFRLWTEADHRSRPEAELPEIRRLDLAEAVLLLAAAGVDRLEDFPWVDPPDPGALERALLLLRDLGALDADRIQLTATGRAMAAFPLHPRLARMLLEAGRRGCLRGGALLSALTQGRSLLVRRVDGPTRDRRDDLLANETSSDLLREALAWSEAARQDFRTEACRGLGIHAQAARQVAAWWQRLLELARRGGFEPGPEAEDPALLRRCLLAGFADQVARRLDRGTLRCELVHRRRATLARESAVQNAPLLVATEITEIGGTGGEVTVLLAGATAIEEAWLEEVLPGSIHETTTIGFDPATRRVTSVRRRFYRDLLLEERAGGEPGDAEATAFLMEEIRAGRCPRPDAWDDTVETWINRVNLLAAHFPDYGIPAIGPAERDLLLEHAIHGARSAKDVRRADVAPVLREWLSPEQAAFLDISLPERLELPGGRRARLRYPVDTPPVLSSRIQDFFELCEHPTLAEGRIRPLVELLAPNNRPVQLTDDLPAFWSTSYPAIRKELRGRYPKHHWPEPPPDSSTR
ncbi:MAG: ATP-dependent helicase HrpB [Puniceicoccaceae bacterium]|nr:MAG: ATP-dependent helicase HrpB [Puniceicoccaceae bacterium]